MARWGTLSKEEHHARLRGIYGDHYRAILEEEKKHAQATAVDFGGCSDVTTASVEVHKKRKPHNGKSRDPDM